VYRRKDSTLKIPGAEILFTPRHFKFKCPIL
jgi:hypothetical protein